MLEHIAQRARFRQWLQDVASGKMREYPEPSNLALDARIVLETDDSLRREIRQLREHSSSMRSQLSAAANIDPSLPDAEWLEQLSAKLRNPPKFSREPTEIKPSPAEAQLREELDRARTRIAELDAELAAARAALEAEQRKLGPVIRYAYRLRRLVQSIYIQGELTGKHRSLIEELLRAGGVPINGDRQDITRN